MAEEGENIKIVQNKLNLKKLEGEKDENGAWKLKKFWGREHVEWLKGINNEDIIRTHLHEGSVIGGGTD